VRRSARRRRRLRRWHRAVLHAARTRRRGDRLRRGGGAPMRMRRRPTVLAHLGSDRLHPLVLLAARRGAHTWRRRRRRQRQQHTRHTHSDIWLALFLVRLATPCPLPRAARPLSSVPSSPWRLPPHHIGPNAARTWGGRALRAQSEPKDGARQRRRSDLLPSPCRAYPRPSRLNIS
jgi:hypothetical protein